MTKGWINKDLIHENPMRSTSVTEMMKSIHVHQTSPEALEGEAVVRVNKNILGGMIAVPPALIGKRVRWIIEVIEEGE